MNCCAKGEDVASTFIDQWDGETEEGEPSPIPLLPGQVLPHPNKNFDGWAAWSGTSFAAPKVSAAIADAVAQSIVNGQQINPGDAWDQLKANGTVVAGVDMGVRFDTLP